MEIIQNTDIKKTQEAAALSLREALFSARDRATLFLLSGGSAFDILPDECATANITIGMLDERHDRDPSINNFLQFQKTEFYKIAQGAGARFIDSVPKENELSESFAGRIEGEWKQWKKENENGMIIITEGMGADGHTAGVLPFPENPEWFAKLFLNEKRWIAGYDAGAKNQYPRRATATLSFLKNEVDVAIAYIAGESKKPAFEKLISETGELAKTPARIMREMKNVKIFTSLNTQRAT